MSIQNLAELFRVAAGHDKPDCLLHKVGGAFVPVSTAELVDRVRRLVTALDGYGVARGDRVALMAENGIHWPTVDFAALTTGAILAPIYPTLTADQAAYVANDCGAEIIFVQGRERLAGLLAERHDMPKVRNFILIGDESGDPAIPELEGLIADSQPIAEAELDRRIAATAPDDLATFIYTSGTTGNPKGVMLTHGNIASNVVSCLECMDITSEHTALSFLPLSHSFERTVDYIYFYRGASIAYAESVQAVAQNFGEVKPHVFVSVPRVYEKVIAKIYENVAKSPPLKRKIFHWAEGVGRRALPDRLMRRRPSGLAGVKLALADKLVFAKIRKSLGGRFEFAMSGGAPLAQDIAEFFWAAGIEIYEGYGLSETSPVLTVNVRGNVRLGTVGPAIPGVELRIAGDGEILARGPNIMKGYYNLPEATAEAIDAEGWFHTGDIGEIDGEGFLKITDRKKEIIVNAYGKNVAPAPIENALKSSRFIEQAVVVGDRRKLLSALLVPDFEALKTWASRQGVDGGERRKLLADERVRALFAGEVEKVNRGLAKYEQVHLWDLLPAEFTIETGELTPTQKVKRRVINEKYGRIVDELYRRAEARQGG